MWRSRVASILILCVFAQLTGCSNVTMVRVPPADPGHEKDRLVGVTTLAGEDVRFDAPAHVVNEVVHGIVKRAIYTLPVGEVSHFWFEQRSINTGKTIGLTAALVVGSIATLFLIALATKESCPFVYSWDGSRYEFDAEPYGGATSRGLERDDFSELEHLRADGGTYRLLVRNEVPETQNTNLMELWVTDHPAGTRVIADERGRLHTVQAPRPPLSARDRTGRDLLPWLAARDRLTFEPSAVADASSSYRHEVVMEFARPADASSVKLVANVATGQWGSHMIRQMLALRGRELTAWYETLDGDPAALQALLDWNLREEVYTLKVEVQEGSEWVVRGLLPGGGPFISEDRVVVLDVSGVTGDRLRVRVRPPAGFWALNWFALDSSADRPVKLDRLAPLTARDHHGQEIGVLLAATDESYHEMAAIGDHAWLTFPAPPPVAGAERTVFLHSRGWYRLHLAADGEPDHQRLKRISDEPDGAAAYAAELFAAWPHGAAAAAARR